ncbi:MAG: hypothetical protein ACHQO8_01210 [Vicinamibacterales bacterium]
MIPRAAAAMLAFAALVSSPAVTGRQQSVFRAGANGISVDVSVRNGNQPVLNLGASDFIVYDNNVRQTVDAVSLGAVPVDVTLFLGTSNQSERQQLGALSADLRKIGGLLRAGDRARLLTLENQVTDVFGWWTSGDPEPPMNARVGGVESLYDACFLAMMERPDPDRRHLIIAITDGVEFGSVVDSSTVRDVARRAEAVLNLVLVNAGLLTDAAPASAANQSLVRGMPPGMNPSPSVGGGGYGFLRASWFHVRADVEGSSRLQEAVRLTGGTVRHADPGESIVESFRRAFEDFRQSYVLRYTVTGVPPAGWHDLRVEVPGGQKYTIRARKGYFGG